MWVLKIPIIIVEEIAKILNTNFVEILISKAEEADMKINRAINRGIDFIVGDAISVNWLKYVINGKFINSGKNLFIVHYKKLY